MPDSLLAVKPFARWALVMLVTSVVLDLLCAGQPPTRQFFRDSIEHALTIALAIRIIEVYTARRRTAGRAR